MWVIQLNVRTIIVTCRNGEGEGVEYVSDNIPKPQDSTEIGECYLLDSKIALGWGNIPSCELLGTISINSNKWNKFARN